jgi:pyroglutamyl-peptidase
MRDVRAAAPPKLLVTGFGPFPGAPENPTEALVRTLAEYPPEAFGADALRAVVLPAEYRRSWAKLRRHLASFAPDVVAHFGLNGKAEAIQVERVGRRRCADAPDAAGFAPPSGMARRAGPDALPSTLPVEPLVAALMGAGLLAAVSDDAGGYVCNATFYRSLATAPEGRMVGFVHVPPEWVLSRTRLLDAARTALVTASDLWKSQAFAVPMEQKA